MFTPARIRGSTAMAWAEALPPREWPTAPIRVGSIIAACFQAVGFPAAGRLVSSSTTKEMSAARSAAASASRAADASSVGVAFVAVLERVLEGVILATSDRSFAQTSG